MKANHQTQMEESLIANIAIEKDIRSIIADSILNIPITANQIRHESAKDPVIRKAMNFVQRKMACTTGSRRFTGLIQPSKGPLCY